MKIAGIIAEFNPFHKGHKFIIERAREELNADLVIILMSGNFVQRGEPAVFDLNLRTEAALKGGADMVFELPPVYALSSAEGFAAGAVKLLSSLGADDLIFGSECGDLSVLNEAADILSLESDGFKAALNRHLKEGMSFPSARDNAFKELVLTKSPSNMDILNEILQKPNNILAIEYLKAIKTLDLPINPYTVKRIGAQYHGETTEPGAYDHSAEMIRNIINSGDIKRIDIKEFDIIGRAISEQGIVEADSLTPLLLYRLLSEGLKDGLEKAAVPEGLSDRIMNNRNYTGSFNEFRALLKTRNITYTAVSRHLLHLILDMNYREEPELNYVRLLGFRRASKKGFGCLKKRSKLAILSNSSDLKAHMDSSLKSHLRIDQTYNILRSPDFRKKTPFPPEISRRIVII